MNFNGAPPWTHHHGELLFSEFFMAIFRMMETTSRRFMEIGMIP